MTEEGMDGGNAGSSQRFWRLFKLAFGAVLFLVILLVPGPEGLSPEAQRLAAITVLMGIYWITEPIPMAVTSLLPIALYPLCNILPGKTVTQAYSDPSVFLYLGGFLLALGIERWGLHRRIALHVLQFMGTSPRRIVFGFMFATGGLSMWISNSATALMMVPIGLALLKTLGESLARSNVEDSDTFIRKLSVPLLLGIAYAASVGGIGTYVGTPTNMVFRGFWGQQYVPQGYPDVTFAEWMIVFAPVSALMLALCGLVTTWNLPRLPQSELLTRDFFKDQLRELGPIRPAEMKVAVLFGLTAAMWILKEPLKIDNWQVLPDWPSLVVKAASWIGFDLSYFAKNIHDSTIAILMSLFLFILPGDGPAASRPRLLTWKEAERGIPWGMLLLFGGGFAMANAFGSTKLADWLGVSLSGWISGQSPFIILLMVCALVTALTEFTSNTATANMLMPVLAAVAIQSDIDPRLLLIPATVSASCGFMMPVGTPPNAIVFATGRVPIRSMMAYGLVLNIIGVVVVATFMMFVATAVMNIPFPK